ncbi:MAG TPA: phosphatidate cytidylyltransferase [Tepidisphaeraceae bacterium]|jgi:phosphatidate cytidylyltransferase
MSPHAAIHDPIFRTYCLLAAGVLGCAGLLLLFLSYGLRKDIRPIWITYRSWLVMVPLILLAVFLGRVAVIAGVALLSIFAFKEYARATGLYRDWWMTLAVYVGILAVAAAALVEDPFDHWPGWMPLFLVMPVFAICLILLIPIVRNRTHGQLQAIALASLGFLYIGWMFGHLGFFANSTNPYGYLLYVIFATELNDVFAFVFGKLLGKHPLRSNISPRKTWEGAIGALGISAILPLLCRFSFPPQVPARELLLIGLIVGIAGQLGDLCISVIKRDIGIKDMGASIPGHGGLLDRIDSLIFVAPLVLHLLNYSPGLNA